MMMVNSTTQDADRVLVVEDEPALLKSYARILGAHNWRVVRCESAERALALLRSEAVDLIVCDINLPGIDGMALLRQLRAGRPDVPVVLVTGAPDTDSAIEAVEYGAFRYLTKPVEASKLVDVVSNGLRLRRFARLQRDAATLRETSGRHQSLERKFEDALLALWMAYQPIVDAETRDIFSYEALVRTSAGSMSSPLEMFDAAERLDRVFDLGRAIRGRVSRDIAPAEHTIFVNLHPRDLLDEQLFQPNPHASRIVLEVTERAPLEHIDDLRGRLGRLKEQGYRIALDDLGAGYSGLVSFTQLEPDIVKLDMALTRQIETSTTKQKLVASMLSLCRDLNILAVAEGIETVAECGTLRELGCRYFQGFLFSKPSPPFVKLNAWPLP